MKMEITEKEKLANGLVIQVLTTIESGKPEDRKILAKKAFLASSFAVAKDLYAPELGFKRLADEILLNVLPIVYSFTMDEIKNDMDDWEKNISETVDKKDNKEV